MSCVALSYAAVQRRKRHRVDDLHRLRVPDHELTLRVIDVVSLGLAQKYGAIVQALDAFTAKREPACWLKLPILAYIEARDGQIFIAAEREEAAAFGRVEARCAGHFDRCRGVELDGAVERLGDPEVARAVVGGRDRGKHGVERLFVAGVLGHRSVLA